jgi:hypothetical protein
VIPQVRLRNAQDGPLFVGRQSSRGEVRHPHRFARWGRKSRGSYLVVLRGDNWTTPVRTAVVLNA